jgi:adenylate cyclase
MLDLPLQPVDNCTRGVVAKVSEAKVENRGPPRKLTTILCADVAGYTRLMHLDEEGTFQRLQACRAIIDRLIVEHRGRLFGSAGDSVITEFTSPVEAVRCALEIQRAIAAQEGNGPDETQMRFRIGINLGDVIIQGDDLIGDGVNLAARLEAMAEPGSLCVSAGVFEQVRSRLQFDHEDLGEQRVKNISEPVRVYRVRDRALFSRPPVATRDLWRRRGTWAGLGIATLLLIAGALLYRNGLVPWALHSTSPAREHASIAVLPFANLSGDATQEYFSYGITEGVISALSRFPDLSVIAHQAVLQYKGRPVGPGTLSRDLGVRYQVEGSILKDGDRVRVTAQLSNALTGVQIWSQHFDGGLKDVFAFLDEIGRNVAGVLAVKVMDLEKQRALEKPTESLQAYDYLLRGRDFSDRNTRSANREARNLLEQSIALDPGYAAAYAALGDARLKEAVYGWTEFWEETLQQAKALAEKAIDLDPDNAEAHSLLSEVYFNLEQFGPAIGEADRALALNPSDDNAYATKASVEVFAGDPQQAVEDFQIALRLNPDLPTGRLNPVGWAYYLARRYDDAVVAFDDDEQRYPDDYFVHAGLAASYAQLGRASDASHAAARVRSTWPFFSVEAFAYQFQGEAKRTLVGEGLRKAGLK